MKLKGPRIDADGVTYFSDPDLALYEIAQLKAENADYQLRVAKLELQELKRAHEAQLRDAAARVAILGSARLDTIRELKKTQDAVGEAYQVDLSRVSYDDETGRLSLDGSPLIRTKKPRKAKPKAAKRKRAPRNGRA